MVTKKRKREDKGLKTQRKKPKIKPGANKRRRAKSASSQNKQTSSSEATSTQTPIFTPRRLIQTQLSLSSGKVQIIKDNPICRMLNSNLENACLIFSRAMFQIAKLADLLIQCCADGSTQQFSLYFAPDMLTMCEMLLSVYKQETMTEQDIVRHLERMVSEVEQKHYNTLSFCALGQVVSHAYQMENQRQQQQQKQKQQQKQQKQQKQKQQKQQINVHKMIFSSSNFPSNQECNFFEKWNQCQYLKDGEEKEREMDSFRALWKTREEHTSSNDGEPVEDKSQWNDFCNIFNSSESSSSILQFVEFQVQHTQNLHTLYAKALKTLGTLYPTGIDIPLLFCYISYIIILQARKTSKKETINGTTYSSCTMSGELVKECSNLFILCCSEKLEFLRRTYQFLMHSEKNMEQLKSARRAWLEKVKKESVLRILEAGTPEEGVSIISTIFRQYPH